MEDIIKAVKDQLDEEMKREKINTNKIRILTEALDKFESMNVTKVGDVLGQDPGVFSDNPIFQAPAIMGRVHTGNSVMDSFLDIANVMLKGLAYQGRQLDITRLVGWYHFLGDISVGEGLTQEQKDAIKNLKDIIINRTIAGMENHIKAEVELEKIELEKIELEKEQ